MQQDASAAEFAAMVSRFSGVALRWCLDDGQTSDLIGTMRPTDLGRGVHAQVLLGPAGLDAERRMRLVIEVDALLRRLVPDDADVAVWLRSADVGFEDAAVTPLEAMSTGAPAIRALRDFLLGLPAQSDGSARSMAARQ